ncbi:MAG: hypothetical protein JSS50_00350 [Proteobacteria bacterium]|nr:hypothetical protein [Pseudomonadota bacterium]
MKRDIGNPVADWLLGTTAGQTTVLLAGTTLLFALSPLLFGSATALLKAVVGIVVPTALLSTTALIANLVYSGSRCLASTILGKLIWNTGTKGMALCGLGDYGFNQRTLNNSDKVVEVCASSMHYLILCGTLALYCFHAYSQLMRPNFYDFMLCGALGAWLGTAMMFTPSLIDDMDRHNTGIFKRMTIGAANGVLLSGSQMLIGHCLCTSMLELGYMGAVIGFFANLIISPYLSKTLLDIFSSSDELKRG